MSHLRRCSPPPGTFFLILTPSLHISLFSTFFFFASSSFLHCTQQSPYPHQLLPPSIIASDTPVVTTTSLAIQHADPMHHDCLYMSTLLCPSFLMLFKKWVRWFFFIFNFYFNNNCSLLLSLFVWANFHYFWICISWFKYCL